MIGLLRWLHGQGLLHGHLLAQHLCTTPFWNPKTFIALCTMLRRDLINISFIRSVAPCFPCQSSKPGRGSSLYSDNDYHVESSGGSPKVVDAGHIKTEPQRSLELMRDCVSGISCCVWARRYSGHFVFISTKQMIHSSKCVFTTWGSFVIYSKGSMRQNYLNIRRAQNAKLSCGKVFLTF